MHLLTKVFLKWVVLMWFRGVLGDTDDTTIYRDTKSHDTSIAEVTILLRY